MCTEASIYYYGETTTWTQLKQSHVTDIIDFLNETNLKTNLRSRWVRMELVDPPPHLYKWNWTCEPHTPKWRNKKNNWCKGRREKQKSSVINRGEYDGHLSSLMEW